MADRFYTNCPLQPGRIVLDGPEAHHLATVCRLRPGDAVCLFNGDGREYAAVVEKVGKRAVALEVRSSASPERELRFRLQFAAPLPKGDRAQFLLEKLTELGVATYIPLRTRRSVIEPREAKLEKLQRHVIEACKQCGRNVLLDIEPLVDWADFCRRGDLPALRIVAHPDGKQVNWQSGQAAVVAVGPEGGFTDDEIEKAVRAGWWSVDLGPRILRVETAALVLAALASGCGQAT